MAENVKLLCPFCVKEGRAEPSEVSADFVRIPALLPRWVPKWAREKGFISLEQAIDRDTRFSSLVVMANGRKEARGLCVQHGFALKEAKIWTDKLAAVQERRAAAAERKATEAFGSIASILGGKQALADAESKGAGPEDEGTDAEARAEQEAAQRRTLVARKKAEKLGKPKPKAKVKGSTKGRAKGALRKEIDEALEGGAS